MESDKQKYLDQMTTILVEYGLEILDDLCAKKSQHATLDEVIAYAKKWVKRHLEPQIKGKNFKRL